MAKKVKLMDSNGNLIAGEIKVADTFLSRFRGLMLSKEPSENEGLLLSPCSSIHMMFMLYAIDAVFVDASLKVVALYESLKPWIGLSSLHSAAKSVIELKAGSVKRTGIKMGDTLKLEYYNA